MENTCENCKYHDMPTTSGICLECLHIPAVCALWERKTITNADRIRSMTDEELAMWINDLTTNALSVLALGSNKQTKTISHWYDWLRKEANE